MSYSMTSLPAPLLWERLSKPAIDSYKETQDAQDAIEDAEKEAERAAARDRSKADLGKLIELFRNRNQQPAEGGVEPVNE